MLNGLATNRNLPQSTLNNLPHFIFSIQDTSRLLILININLNLIQKFFINLLKLMYQR